MRIYGSGMEPDGGVLDCESTSHACASCDGRGLTNTYEEAEGRSTKTYFHTWCLDCPYTEGVEPTSQGYDVLYAQDRERGLSPEEYAEFGIHVG